MNTPFEAAVRVLTDVKAFLVITGAGISAESGLPTFRGANGIFNQSPDLPVLLSAEGLARHRNEVWDFINRFRMQVAAARPNEAHRVLARWEQERRFERFLIATQNIDGLHQAAGNDRVSELHGSAWQIACPRDQDYATDEGFAREFQSIMAKTPDREVVLRRWSEANGRKIWEDREVPFRSIPPYRDPDYRPNVLFFDEEYGHRLLWVRDFISQKPDAVLVIGCSGALTILPRLLGDCRRANPRCQIISLNVDPDMDIPDAIHISQPATRALCQIEKALP